MYLAMEYDQKTHNLKLLSQKEISDYNNDGRVHSVSLVVKMQDHLGLFTQSKRSFLHYCQALIKIT